MNAFDTGCIGYQILIFYSIQRKTPVFYGFTGTRTNLFKFGRLFNFQVVNRRKMHYAVYNTVCKKQEGATNCVFCVF